MRVVVVYKQQTDYTRQVEDWLADFKRQTARDLDTLDPESLLGLSFCETYDVVEYPSIIALSDDGQMQNFWRGLPLPTLSEVSYYV
ncbi:MAG: hypothetical protein ACOH18_05220 [Candidatus Saccharimonadaceae bacterium]